jgi:hypothetical protein
MLIVLWFVCFSVTVFKLNAYMFTMWRYTYSTMPKLYKNCTCRDNARGPLVRYWRPSIADGGYAGHTWFIWQRALHTRGDLLLNISIAQLLLNMPFTQLLLNMPITQLLLNMPFTQLLRNMPTTQLLLNMHSTQLLQNMLIARQLLNMPITQLLLNISTIQRC